MAIVQEIKAILLMIGLLARRWRVCAILHLRTP